MIVDCTQGAFLLKTFGKVWWYFFFAWITFINTVQRWCMYLLLYKLDCFKFLRWKEWLLEISCILIFIFCYIYKCVFFFFRAKYHIYIYFIYCLKTVSRNFSMKHCCVYILATRQFPLYCFVDNAWWLLLIQMFDFN